jgi:hypothetical protein
MQSRWCLLIFKTGNSYEFAKKFLIQYLCCIRMPENPQNFVQILVEASLGFTGFGVLNPFRLQVFRSVLESRLK